MKKFKYLASFLFLLLIPVLTIPAQQEFEIQEFTRNGIVIRPVRVGNRVTIDWQTSEDETERVTTTFNRSASVSFSREDQAFLRLDGLIGNTSEINRNITELVSHYHDDHISPTLLEQCLSDNNFRRIVAPYPSTNASLNDNVFLSLVDYMGNAPRSQNYVLDITPPGTMPFNLTFRTFGNFIYTSFVVNWNIKVELFKYLYPRGSNPNDDGLIYRVTHNGVSYLLFGDFDNINGIENLFNIYAKIEEDIRELYTQQLFNVARVSGIAINALNTDLFSPYCHVHKMRHLNKIAVLSFFAETSMEYKQLSSMFESTQNRIDELDEELANLPTLRADVIKWPHHAHRFSNNDEADDRTDNVIIKMNEVVNPRFIIWQTHSAQENNNFDKYIERFNFKDKFLCSDGIDFNFISLLELLREERVS